LRIQGDWSASWEAESKAAGIFQELGDRVPLAQVMLKQANLFLDQNKVEEAAKSVHQASELLSQANALIDQAFAQIMLARTFLTMGRPDDAENAISKAKLFAQRSQDKELGIASQLESARIEMASASVPRREVAMRNLRNLTDAAKKEGFLYASFEARLDLAALEKNSKSANSAKNELAAIRKEASTAGFVLIANRADVELNNFGR
jgi:hypothetical protein